MTIRIVAGDLNCRPEEVKEVANKMRLQVAIPPKEVNIFQGNQTSTLDYILSNQVMTAKTRIDNCK